MKAGLKIMWIVEDGKFKANRKDILKLWGFPLKHTEHIFCDCGKIVMNLSNA